MARNAPRLFVRIMTGRRVANIFRRLLRTLPPKPNVAATGNTKRGAGAPLFRKIGSGERLERKSDSELGLQRVTNTLAQETVKIEQPRSHQRIYIVRIIEAIEQIGRAH